MINTPLDGLIFPLRLSPRPSNNRLTVSIDYLFSKYQHGTVSTHRLIKIIVYMGCVKTGEKAGVAWPSLKYVNVWPSLK